MVQIEIDDEFGNCYKKSYALMGIREHEELIQILEDQLRRESVSVISDAEKHLIDDTPEAYVQREIGLMKERGDEINSKPKSGMV
jgi:hypothetical protein